MIQNYCTLLFTKLYLLMTGIGTGSMEDTKNAFKPVFDKLKPLLSAGVNIASIGFGVYFSVKAAMAAVNMANKKSPQEKEAAKSELIGCLIGAGISFSLGIIINVLLATFVGDSIKIEQ